MSTRMKTEGICRVEGILSLKRNGDERKTRALLDTGASRSFIAERALKHQGDEVQILGEKQVNVRAKGFSNGITQTSSKAVWCTLKLGRVEKQVEALVVKDVSEEFILGIKKLRHG